MEGDRAQCAITNPGDAKAPPKNFTFDGAYFTDSTTESIYNEIAYPLVEVSRAEQCFQNGAVISPVYTTADLVHVSCNL